MYNRGRTDSTIVMIDEVGRLFKALMTKAGRQVNITRYKAMKDASMTTAVHGCSTDDGPDTRRRGADLYRVGFL